MKNDDKIAYDGLFSFFLLWHNGAKGCGCMDIKIKIEKTHFSESEATFIMRYILRSGEKIPDMTTKDIAEATFTSAPL